MDGVLTSDIMSDEIYHKPSVTSQRPHSRGGKPFAARIDTRKVKTFEGIGIPSGMEGFHSGRSDAHHWTGQYVLICLGSIGCSRRQLIGSIHPALRLPKCQVHSCACHILTKQAHIQGTRPEPHSIDQCYPESGASRKASWWDMQIEKFCLMGRSRH